MAKYSDSRLQYCKRVVTPTAEIELPARYPNISINPKVVSRYQNTPIIKIQTVVVVRSGDSIVQQFLH
ncbi:MAG: hypothetical protein MGG11_03935 [Trichodesmium sp. MAG_R03]|nr:hypothetical protein [Trichodesmium sp. MAG_R03]